MESIILNISTMIEETLNSGCGSNRATIKKKHYYKHYCKFKKITTDNLKHGQSRGNSTVNLMHPILLFEQWRQNKSHYTFSSLGKRYIIGTQHNHFFLPPNIIIFDIFLLMWGGHIWHCSVIIHGSVLRAHSWRFWGPEYTILSLWPLFLIF